MKFYRIYFISQKIKFFLILCGALFLSVFFISGAFAAQNLSMGDPCGINPAEQCGPNLVCSALSLGEQEICLGTADSPGCAVDANGEPVSTPQDADQGKSNDRCAIGLVCNTMLSREEKQGICMNDYGGGKAEELKLGEESQDIRIQLNRVVNIFLSFLAVIGVILIIYGGILWATSGGNDEQAGKARKVIIAAAIGLIIIGIAWTLTSYIINLGSSIS